jgi:acyl-CoA hydrolase
MTEPVSRIVADSRVEMTEIVMPNDANPLGNAMGGRVMHWIDVCAAVCAGRHARTPVVTASVDNVDFHNPVPVGGVIVLLASVNYTGRTSMEVGVKVWQEDRATGDRKHVVSAYLTFVSLDPETRKPSQVPAIVPETDEQRRRCKEAEARRKARLS